MGRGVGSALYGALLPALRELGVHRAYAGIALPNAASLALHRRHGFTDLGTYREVGRKFDRWLDVPGSSSPSRNPRRGAPGSRRSRPVPSGSA